MIPETLLEIHDYNGEGYRPLIDYGAWRVAILNYIDELLPENIGKMQLMIGHPFQKYLQAIGRGNDFLNPGNAVGNIPLGGEIEYLFQNGHLTGKVVVKSSR